VLAVQWLVSVLVTWAINVLALVVADWAFDSFEIERWWPVIWAGAILGLANAFLRPIVKILALPLIVITLGVAYLFVNMLMLLVTEWVSPDLTIDGFWTYVGATIVVGLVNWLASVVINPFVGRRS
jgi:putative membrane protein